MTSQSTSDGSVDWSITLQCWPYFPNKECDNNNSPVFKTYYATVSSRRTRGQGTVGFFPVTVPEEDRNNIRNIIHENSDLKVHRINFSWGRNERTNGCFSLQKMTMVKYTGFLRAEGELSKSFICKVWWN